MLDLPKIIRVLLVDACAATRARLRSALAMNRHLEIVAEAADGWEAIEQARSATPDVVVMEVNLPRLNGLAATALLMREFSGLRVLLLTSQDHPEFVVEIIHSGARGCVSKEVLPADLAHAIVKVAAGDAHFGLAETVRYLRRYLPAPPCAIAEPIKALTARESEIVACINEGLTNRQISERLNVSIRTVETHRERLMRKLDLSDSTALRSFAAAHALLSGVDAAAVSTES